MSTVGNNDVGGDTAVTITPINAGEEGGEEQQEAAAGEEQEAAAGAGETVPGEQEAAADTGKTGADTGKTGADAEYVEDVEEPPKVCVQMVKDKDTYNGIAQGTTIAIKNDDGKYTVFKKAEGDDDKFIENNTFQHLSNSVMGGKRRKSAKRGRKSAKRGRKSAKRGRKSVKRGRKGKGSRRSKK